MSRHVANFEKPNARFHAITGFIAAVRRHPGRQPVFQGCTAAMLVAYPLGAPLQVTWTLQWFASYSIN